VRAAVLQRSGLITLDEVPTPIPGPGEVLIRVRAAAICGSDLARFQGKSHGQDGAPVIMGHEFAGEIAECGPGVTHVRGDQRVAAAPLLNCGVCTWCRQGYEYLCTQRKVFGAQAPGALAEYTLLPARRAYPIPDDLPFEEAALLEPLAIAAHAVRQAAWKPDDSVLILGAGAIGLLIGQLCAGAQPLVVTDVRADRLALARRLEFTAVDVSNDPGVAESKAATGGMGFGIIFDATGSPAAARLYADLLAVRGTICAVGTPAGDVPVDIYGLLRKEGRLVTSRFFSAMDYESALAARLGGPVALAPLITHRFPLSSFADGGARVMQAAQQGLRVVVMP